MKHNIIIESRVGELPEVCAHLRRCIRTALAEEGVRVPCEINVLLTDDEGIRAINREQRQVDAPTDVLSFPMFDLKPGELPADFASYADPATGLVPLGDMALSLERVRAQAKEFGHSVRREAGYLSVHSVLHLLGYDHMDEGPMKRQMRAREEAIMAVLDLRREPPRVVRLRAHLKTKPEHPEKEKTNQ